MVEYADLVGAGFAWGGRGPHVYDCYGLVIELARRAGVALPDYRSPMDGNGPKIAAMMACQMDLWEAMPQQPGAIVLIALPRSSHVATVVDGLSMIHTWEGSRGVVIERIDAWKHRIQGFYRYVG